jgi:hypothetical protein
LLRCHRQWVGETRWRSRDLNSTHTHTREREGERERGRRARNNWRPQWDYEDDIQKRQNLTDQKTRWKNI